MRIGFMVSLAVLHLQEVGSCTLFKRLPIAEQLEPVLLALVSEGNWQKVEEHICAAAAILLAAQNAYLPGLHQRSRLARSRWTTDAIDMNIDFWGISNRTGKRIPTELKTVLNNQVSGCTSGIDPLERRKSASGRSAAEGATQLKRSLIQKDVDWRSSKASNSRECSMRRRSRHRASIPRPELRGCDPRYV